MAKAQVGRRRGAGPRPREVHREVLTVGLALVSLTVKTTCLVS